MLQTTQYFLLNTRSVHGRIKYVHRHQGLFNIPELRGYEGFYLLKENVIQHTDSLIAEATAPVRHRRMVEIFDELSDSLCKVADLAEFIRLAHPQSAFSQAAEDACITVSGVVEKYTQIFIAFLSLTLNIYPLFRLNTHRELYQSLRRTVESKDIFETTAIDDHVARLFLFDFEQCGIHLAETQRQKVVYLNNSILQLGQRFMTGAVHPRQVSKSILPDNIRQ